MKGKTSVSLLVAVALGLVTAKVGWDLVARNRTPSNTTFATVKVLVAKRDIDTGAQIEAEDIGSTTLSADNAPKGAFHDVKDVVGRTVIGQVITGQTMFDGLLAPADSPGGLQALVPD